MILPVTRHSRESTPLIFDTVNMLRALPIVVFVNASTDDGEFSYVLSETWPFSFFSTTNTTRAAGGLSGKCAK